MLHDIGALVLDMCFPDAYSEVRLAIDDDTPLHEVERRILEVDHPQAGAWLAERWQLPPALVAGITGHHSGRGSTEEENNLMHVIQIADVAATHIDMGLGGEHPDGLAQMKSLGFGKAHYAQLVELISETTLCRYVALYTMNPEHFFQIEAVSELFGKTDGFPDSIPAEDLRRVSPNPNEATYIECLDDWNGGVEWPLPYDFQSWLLIPLRSRDTAQGLLILTDDEAGAFPASTQRTLQMVVPQISGALSNTQLYEHLRTSEAKYRTFVERMQDVVYICDRQWQILDMNPAARQMFPHLDAGEESSTLFSSDRAASQLRGTVEIFGSIQNFECELCRPSEDDVSALINAVDDGEQISVVIRNVTEQKLLADRLRRTQKMESIGTLASEIAHDFNNMLGIIVPTAELIQMTEGEGKNLERAETIIDASTRASDLTRQLISLARDETHSVEYVDLNEVVARTAQLLRETIDRTIRLEIVPGAIPPIRVDENQITQVLINLAINARDEMPSGGRITFRTSAEAGRVLLPVADDGPGIDRAIVDKIFDSFLTTKEKGQGTGRD